MRNKKNQRTLTLALVSGLAGLAAVTALTAAAGKPASPAARSASVTQAEPLAPLPGAPRSTLERWWEIRLAGQPTGFYHESVQPAGGGGGGAGTSTTEEMLFVVNRLGSKVEIKSRVETIEDGDGRLTAVHCESSSSRQSSFVDGTRTAAGLELRTRAGGQTYTRVVPLSGPLYGPQGVARLSREKLHAVHERVAYSTFSPTSGGVVEVSRTVSAAARLDGQPALEVAEEIAGLPGKAKVWLDARGRMLQRSDGSPIGEMLTRSADRAAALRATAGGELPSEAYDRTMARSNVRLPDPRAIEAIRLRLTHHRPDLGWPAFEGPHQRVLAKSPDSVVLEVRRPAAGPAAGASGEAGADPSRAAGANPSQQAGAQPSELDSTRFLAPNPLLQSDDPAVAALARELAGDATIGRRDPLGTARKLQDWAARNLELDLRVALAPASEVVRNRRGTCIAFAVLLAALERAAGIPSRVAMGYVYVDGIWGGHAWTEILAGGQWLPLDAAAYAPGIADAARFQFGSYTLEDNLAAATGAGLQTYGNIDVTVLSYTLRGRTVEVPAGAPAYAVAGDVYRNPWLGFSLRKPSGFRFDKMNAVYPDSTIVAVTGNGGGGARRFRRLEVAFDALRSDPDAAIARRLDAVAPAGSAEPAQLDHRAALVISSGEKARLVAADGASLWTLTAEGPDARRLLGEVAAGWKWTPAN